MVKCCFYEWFFCYDIKVFLFWMVDDDIGIIWSDFINCIVGLNEEKNVCNLFGVFGIGYW